MDESDPKLLFLITYNRIKNKSAFHILKILKKHDGGSFIFGDDGFKQELVSEIKRNLPHIENLRTHDDNYKITVSNRETVEI